MPAAAPPGQDDTGSVDVEDDARAEKCGTSKYFGVYCGVDTEQETARVVSPCNRSNPKKSSRPCFFILCSTYFAARLDDTSRPTSFFIRLATFVREK